MEIEQSRIWKLKVQEHTKYYSAAAATLSKFQSLVSLKQVDLEVVYEERAHKQT
jgi:hypothetical protein